MKNNPEILVTDDANLRKTLSAFCDTMAMRWQLQEPKSCTTGQAHECEQDYY